MKQSAHGQITRKISLLKPGNLIFPSDFKGIGTEIAVKNALSRLAKEKKIERLAHGIYLLPQYDPKFGKLKPTLERMATAIAKHYHIRIKPTGAYALNKLGLSTQVPMKQVYITDGLPKHIKVGKGTIEFKATTPKRLSMKGPISSLIIQALDELEIKELESDDDFKNKILTLLQKEKTNLLQHDLKLAPARISDYIFRIFGSIHNDHVKKCENDRVAAKLK